MANLNQLTNAELENFILDLKLREKKIQAEFIFALAEIDIRKLYLNEGYPSLFAYVTQKLGYSEASAHKRIQLARHGSKHPELLMALEEGKIHLSGASVIAPHLTEENKVTLIEKIKGKSLDDIRWCVAEINQRPAVKDLVKEQKKAARETSLTTSHSSNSVLATTKHPLALPKSQEIKPTNAEQATIRFSCSKEFVLKLKRCQELLKATGKSNLENVFERALDLMLEKIDPEKRQERREQKSEKKQGEENSQIIVPRLASNPVRKPISIKTRDQVFKKFGSQCSYISAEGKRCSTRSYLQIDHIKSVCHGGGNEIENLQLLCTAHHSQKTKRQLGFEFINQILQLSKQPLGLR